MPKVQEIAEKTRDITQNSRIGNLIFYLPLVVLSAISASLIASLCLIAFLGYMGLAALFMYAILQRVQWILVIPATAIIYFLYSSLSNKGLFHKLNHLARIGIPLMFNIVGASSIYILFFFAVDLPRLQNDASSSYIYNNVDFAIKNEALIPWSVPNPNMHYIAYQVTLHVKNDLQKEISSSFMLERYDDYHTGPGAGQHTKPISQGESDIIVNVPILVRDLQCDGKPLYLFYFIDSRHSKSIAMADSNINQELQQIACSSTPTNEPNLSMGTPTPNWEDLPVIPGAYEVEPEGFGYIYSVNVTVEEAEKFYMEQMELGGWTLSNRQAGVTGTFLDFQRDNEEANVVLIFNAIDNYTMVITNVKP